jgi:inhibitor of KinA sporulation pathway (predicted exonuclease)
MANNLIHAGLEDVGKRLSGQAHHGAAGARMAGSMAYKSAQMQSDLDKPVPPHEPQATPGTQQEDNRIYV